jgi:hypothetical protein
VLQMIVDSHLQFLVSMSDERSRKQSHEQKNKQRLSGDRIPLGCENGQVEFF